jgi:hypothetical protein
MGGQDGLALVGEELVLIQAELLALQRGPQEHPPRVVEQELRVDILHELGRLAS